MTNSPMLTCLQRGGHLTQGARQIQSETDSRVSFAPHYPMSCCAKVTMTMIELTALECNMPARTRNAEKSAAAPCKSSVGASHRNDSSVRCDQVVTTIMALQLLKAGNASRHRSKIWAGLRCLATGKPFRKSSKARHSSISLNIFSKYLGIRPRASGCSLKKLKV